MNYEPTGHFTSVEFSSFVCKIFLVSGVDAFSRVPEGEVTGFQFHPSSMFVFIFFFSELLYDVTRTTRQPKDKTEGHDWDHVLGPWTGAVCARWGLFKM